MAIIGNIPYFQTNPFHLTWGSIAFGNPRLLTQWIGLKEHWNRKPEIFPLNMGLSGSNFPLYKPIHWLTLLTINIGVFPKTSPGSMDSVRQLSPGRSHQTCGYARQLFEWRRRDLSGDGYGSQLLDLKERFQILGYNLVGDWNMAGLWLSIQLGMESSSHLTNSIIFQRVGSTTNQI